MNAIRTAIQFLLAVEVELRYRKALKAGPPPGHPERVTPLTPTDRHLLDPFEADLAEETRQP